MLKRTLIIGKHSFTFRRRKKESVKGRPYFIYFFKRERERERREMQNENSLKHSSQVCHLDTALILYISKIRVDLVPNKTEKEGVFS